MIETAIIGTILGFISNVLPMGLKLWQNKWEIDKEIKLKTLEFDLAKQRIEAEGKNLATQMELADILAAVREGESLRAHDMSIHPDNWVDVLRAMVRPVITFILFGFWLAVKVAMLYHLVVDQSVPFITAAPVILDPFTTGLLSAVVGFWFGSRSIERYGKLQLDRR